MPLFSCQRASYIHREPTRGTMGARGPRDPDQTISGPPGSSVFFAPLCSIRRRQFLPRK